jgi:hypothetical protein
VVTSKRAVVGGVAIEATCTFLLFGFDEWISQKQQLTIASLERHNLPRTFDVKTFAEPFKSAPVANAEILYVEDCTDCAWLASWIGKILSEAYWPGPPVQPIHSLRGTWVTAVSALKAHWYDTLTAREGYLVQPSVLLYVQGGAAWASTSLTVFNASGRADRQLIEQQPRLDARRRRRMDVRAALVGVRRI